VLIRPLGAGFFAPPLSSIVQPTNSQDKLTKTAEIFPMVIGILSAEVTVTVSLTGWADHL
jgi:hypothetical protein